MFHSGTFWLMLAASVAVFWLLPPRLRLGFLALASAAFLATLAPASVLTLLVISSIFYLAAPVAQAARKARVSESLVARLARATATDSARAGADAGQQTGAACFAVVEEQAREDLPPRSYRWTLPLLIGGIVGYLLVFKYLPPLYTAILGPSRIAHIALPLGISYFTFKLIHYAIEMTRGTLKPHRASQFFCYVFLFPTFTAGPIERFDHFLAQRQPDFDRALFVEGLTRIVHGLIKKFALQLSLLPLVFGKASVDFSVAELGSISTADLWGMAVYSYLSLYLDFAAYSDLAIGASRLFGLRIMENFDMPLLAPNISVFWKRWHMTLAGWCQSYIYMPVLGLYRSPYLALYATFITIGLWHGAAFNWIFWGVYHASGIAVLQVWTRFRKRRKWNFVERGLWPYVGIPITFAFVSAGELASGMAVTTPHAAAQVLLRLMGIPLP